MTTVFFISAWLVLTASFLISVGKSRLMNSVEADVVNKELTSPRPYHFLPWFQGFYDSLSFIVLVLKGLDGFVWAGFFSSSVATVNIWKSSASHRADPRRTTAGTLTLLAVWLFILSLQQHLKSLRVCVGVRLCIHGGTILSSSSRSLWTGVTKTVIVRLGGRRRRWGVLCLNPVFMGLSEVVRC